MRFPLLCMMLLLLCSGCQEFRSAFSRPSRKAEQKRERRGQSKNSHYRHPMDEWIFGNKKQRQEFAGALNETERQEWEKFRRSSGGDGVFDREVNSVHQSMSERKRQNEKWVFSPRPVDQEVRREY